MDPTRKFLERYVTEGTLTVQGIDGTARSYGTGAPHVKIRIHDSRWPMRLLQNPALAVGEGYMDGAYSLEHGDIESLLELSIRNTRWGGDHWLPGIRSRLEKAARLAHQYNPVSRARLNVAQHYELSVEFFDLFLDSQRQYSCAYFTGEDDDLETAQWRKLRHIAAKLCLQPGMTVLDIGCGWGGLAIFLARHCDVRVVGITLATEQLQVARQQAIRAGVADRVEFLPLDYRQVDRQFDRVVSVGMFEHVGLTHYKRYFDQIERCLTPDGIALVHTIGRADGPGATNAWTRKYIFPGGYLPALSEIVPAIERKQLYITDVEVLRLHYAKTLRCWLQRCNAQRETIHRMFDERFFRMWEFYLASSMASFRWGSIVVFQIQLARDISAVPITRDYIGAGESALAAETKTRARTRTATETEALLNQPS